MSRFECDEDKNRANRRKHGIGFEEAATIFDGPVLSLEDDSDPSEVRERSYGLRWARGSLRHPHGPERHDTHHQPAQSDPE